MFLIVAAAGMPLDSSQTQMFQLPSVITMSIAATRMHRSLTDFVSNTTEMYVILLILLSPVFTVDEKSSNLSQQSLEVTVERNTIQQD